LVAIECGVFLGIMHQFDHPNIIKLIGVCPSSPMSIVMELAEFGEVCMFPRLVWYLWIYLRPSDIGCQYSRSIYTAHFIMWQPRHAADTSTNWRQSLFCCCTTSMEQATNGAETATIDRLVSSWSENIYVTFSLQAPGYGLSVWCTLSLLVGGTIQVPQLQLQLLGYIKPDASLGCQVVQLPQTDMSY